MKNAHQLTYRILDASANRATEGLRTIEEYVHFVMEDAASAASAKELRHDLALALSRLSRSTLLAARDTESDVGTVLQTESEYSRTSMVEVITAAAQRVQQSMRVLEEYGKTIDVDFSRQIEGLRYRAYTLHREIELSAISSSRTRRLADAVLYLLIDCLPSETEFVTTIRQLSQSGVDIFQLRDKQVPDRILFERARIGARVAKEGGVLWIVNDRSDIAAAADADGVHVGQDELPPAMARRIVGADRLVGVSTHNLKQVHQAIADGADYIGCGPTFPSSTKTFTTHAGTSFLREVHEGTKHTPRPAFAIGGINLDNVDQVLSSGFHRVAVTAAIAGAKDPARAASEFRARLASQQ